MDMKNEKEIGAKAVEFIVGKDWNVTEPNGKDFTEQDASYHSLYYVRMKSCFIAGYQAALADGCYTKQNLLDVMNLGMTLRQDQLNGHSAKSGNEVLGEYIQSLTTK